MRNAKSEKLKADGSKKQLAHAKFEARYSHCFTSNIQKRFPSFSFPCLQGFSGCSRHLYGVKQFATGVAINLNPWIGALKFHNFYFSKIFVFSWYWVIHTSIGSPSGSYIITAIINSENTKAVWKNEFFKCNFQKPSQYRGTLKLEIFVRHKKRATNTRIDREVYIIYLAKTWKKNNFRKIKILLQIRITKWKLTKHHKRSAARIWYKLFSIEVFIIHEDRPCLTILKATYLQCSEATRFQVLSTSGILSGYISQICLSSCGQLIQVGVASDRS